MGRFLIIMVFLMRTSALVAHDYHVCITEIRYNQDSARLEISMQVFIDDFEKALNLAGDKTRINDDLTERKTSKAIESYLTKHFSLGVNGQYLRLDYIGAEWEDDLHSFYAYFEVPVKTEINSLDIFNNVLTEVAPDQQNMHHILIGRFKSSVLTTADEEKASIQL